MIKKALRAAFPHTIPVLAGYIFLGIAYGFLMESRRYPLWYPVIMSIFVYGGALQFASVPLISMPLKPFSSFIMALMISARHLFYGIPMLKKYSDSGKLKPFLMFALTDETFSISSTVDTPDGIEKKYFYTAISVFDYIYWITGTFIGVLFGRLINIDTTGIDFSLTALFLVLFLEQIKTKEGKISGFSGLIITLLVLITAGSGKMVIISMSAILVVLLVGRKFIHNEQH